MILRTSAASKIKVFAGLGYLKEKVLKEHGVIKFDNDQRLLWSSESTIF